jgi:hypothetical protein
VVAGVVAWGLAAMRRDRWHGIVGSRRPSSIARRKARGGVQTAEENLMIRSFTRAEARNDRNPGGDGK